MKAKAESEFSMKADTISPAHRIAALLLEAAKEQLRQGENENHALAGPSHEHEQEGDGEHEYADDPGDVTDGERCR